jgi:hypothetical protein
MLPVCSNAAGRAFLPAPDAAANGPAAQDDQGRGNQPADAESERGTITAARITGQPDRRGGAAREASLSLAGALS